MTDSPSPETIRRRRRRKSREFEAAGQLRRSVKPLEYLVAHGLAERRDHVRRSTIYERLGRYDEALQVLRALYGDRPDRPGEAFRMGRVAHAAYRLGFRLTDSGVVPADRESRADALSRALIWFEIGTGHPRPVPAYRYGRALEDAGRSVDAAAAYVEAIRRAEADASARSGYWMSTWQFRHSYVTRAGGDPRVALRLDAGEPDVAATEVAGHIDVEVERSGVTFLGFLLPNVPPTVTLQVGGATVLTQMADTAHWLPRVQVTLSHEVISELPVTSEFRLTAGDQPLVTGDLASRVVLTNPAGSGTYSARTAAGWTVSKKGTWSPPPQIANDISRPMRAYSAFDEFMRDEFGRDVFLFYGTLLGQHRNGTPIPGDDDIDVAYVTDCASPEEAKADSIEVMRRALSAGFDIGLGRTGRPFNFSYDGEMVDVFPIWFHDGRAWAFQAHALSREVFVPTQQAEFLGHPVRVPNNIEAFLQENYGPQWRTPRPDFRYFRHPEVKETMERTELTLSEARALAAHGDLLRNQDPAAGRFDGWH